MSTENRSEFIEKLKDICEVAPPPEESPKICPTCIPDPNAIEVNWWEQKNPFLNQKNCMYSVSVAFNDEGKSFSVADMRNSGLNVKQLIETYKIFGILQLLRFYNKEISNEIIFAFPENPRKFSDLMKAENRDIANSVQVLQQINPNGISNVYDIPGPVANDLEIKGNEVFNPNALELYAQVNDYYISNYQTPVGGEPILVNVTIPAFIFDRIPQSKAPEQEDTSKFVILDGIELKGKIDRLKHALGVFGKYQAYWWQTEKGRLAFQKSLPVEEGSVITIGDLAGETYEDYYCKNYVQKLDEFIEDLEYLIESETDFKLRRINTPRSVEQIKIFFDNENEENPFTIKKIKITGAQCGPQVLSLNKIKKPGSDDLRPPFSNQTVMGYIANLNSIDSDLQARETPPWVDFVVQYTFPKVSIQYGKGDSLTDFGQPETILGCVVDNMGGLDGLRDFFLETTMTFFDAIQYKWNQNACKTLTGEYEPREGGLFDQREDRRGDTEESKQIEERIDALQEERRFWEEQLRDLEGQQRAMSTLPDEGEFLSEENEQFKNDIDQLRSQNREIRREIRRKERELERIADDFDPNAASASELGQASAQLTNEISSLNETYDNNEKAIQNLKDTINENKEVITDYEEEIPEAYDEAIKSFEDEIEKIKEQLEELEKEKRKAQDSVAKARRENRREAREKNNRDERRSDRNERRQAAADRLLDELNKMQSGVETDEDDEKPSVRKELRQTRRAQRTERRQAKRQTKGEFRGQDPFIKASREAVLDQFDFERSLVSLFLSEEDFKDFGLSGFDFSEPFAKVKDGLGSNKGAMKGKATEGIRRFIARLGICGFNELAKKAIQCLLAGVDLDTALRAIVKAALNAMAPTAMEKLLVGLDPRVQEEIRAKVVEEFGNMPAPWEPGYTPGSITSNEEMQINTLTTLSNKVESVDTKISNLQAEIPSLEEEIRSLKNKMTIIDRIIVQQASSAYDSDAPDTPETAEFDEEKLAELQQQKQDLKDQKELIENSIEAKKKELEDLQNDRDASVPQESSAELAAWQNMSEDQQQRYIEEQQNARTVAIQSPDQFEQGSVGQALGSIQGAIFDAYINAIMDTVEIAELFGALDKIPGARLIARLIASFDCPNVHFIYPPIKSFLSTLSFDICKDRGRLAIPEITNLPDIKSIKELILDLARDAFEYALEVVIVRVVTAFILKILQTLENALCKALESVGRFAAEAVKGPNANFGDVVNELFCGEAADEDELDDITSSLLTSIGLTPQRLDTLAQNAVPASLKDQHKQIVTDISNVTSKRELISLITDNPGEQDLSVLKRISNVVSLRHPSFAFAFDAPDKVAQIFGALGNFITPDQRREIRDRLADQPFDIPIDSSICLTKDQLNEWNNTRKTVLTNAGLTPEEADDVVTKYNDRAKSDLQDLANSLAKGPTTLLQDAIADALKTDPSCEDGNSLTKHLPDEAKKQRDFNAEGVFRSLQIAFTNDMIGKNDSLLDNVLADTLNAPLRKHENMIDNNIFRIDYANSQADWENKKARYDQTRVGSIYFTALSSEEPEGIFPETIGILSRAKFLENNFQFNYNFDIKRNKQTAIQEVDYGFLGLGKKEVKISKGYLKQPDLKLIFDNGNDLKIEFDVESSFTTQEDGVVKIQKNFGQKINIVYEAKNNTLEQQTDIDTNSDRKDKDKIVRIPIYRLVDSTLPDVTASQFIESFDVSFDELQNRKVPYQMALLTNYLNQALTSSVPDSAVQGGFTPFFNKLYKEIAESLVSDKDGDIPIGYKFGYTAASLTTEDMLYVNPEANPDDDTTWEYTYENEDMVLGKSATENPRVHFLDPNIYGGSYVNPPFYVEPEQYQGWLGLAQVIVPEVDGCKPKRTDFIDFKGMSKEVTKIEAKIEPDKRLSQDPGCIKHIPFDHIADPSTLAHLDVIVNATIKVYCAEAMIKSMPIFSFLEYKDRNYDSSLSQLIVKEMEQEMPLETSFIPIGRYQRYNYWLIFLEQAVQSAVRKLDAGEIASTPEIDEARRMIDLMQKDYKYPSPEDLEVVRQLTTINFSDFTTTDKTVAGFVGGLTVLTMPTVLATGGVFLGTVGLGLGLITLRQLRFATKMDFLHRARKHSMVLLKALVDNQLSEMSNLLIEKTSLRPYVSDLNKYILSNDKITGGNTIKAGLYDVEKPITLGESGIEYGDITMVPSFPKQTALAPQLPSDYSLNGCLLLQKYIRITDKPERTIFTQTGRLAPNENVSDNVTQGQASVVPEIISNRPDYLYGVCNIEDFSSWAQTVVSEIDPSLNISDLFGDASVIAGDSTKYDGTIGIQFGVRMCLVLPSTLETLYSNNGISQQTERLEKAFKYQDCFVIPIAKSEYDIKDVKFVDMKFDDTNLGEDLKCHVDKMCDSVEFKTFMNYIFGVNKVSSLASVYMNHSFLQSIGHDSSERDFDNAYERFSEEWKGEILSDTKDEIRRLFVGFYRSNDFEDPDDENDTTLKDFLRNVLPNLFGVNRSLVPWWRRRRMRDRPFDKDGNDCSGEYGSFFKGED